MKQPAESLDEGRITFDAPEDEKVCFDPVCGRRVDAASMLTPRLERGGESHVFCSAACRSRFKSNPDAYKSRQAD